MFGLFTRKSVEEAFLMGRQVGRCERLMPAVVYVVAAINGCRLDRIACHVHRGKAVEQLGQMRRQLGIAGSEDSRLGCDVQLHEWDLSELVELEGNDYQGGG